MSTATPAPKTKKPRRAPALNERQERFAQLVAAGRPASKAHQEAGYGKSKGNPSTLRDNKRVAARIAALMAQFGQKQAARTAVTIDTITAQLGEDRQFARQVGQAGPAVTATKLTAQLHGLLKDDGTTGAVTVNNVVINRVVRVVVNPGDVIEHE